MTASPADASSAYLSIAARALSVALVALVGLATALAGASTERAHAQVNAPLRLAPLDTPERGGGSAVPAPSPWDAAPTSATPSGDAIVVERLGGVDSEAVGLLVDSQGGLGTDVWRNSSRGMIADLLRRAPTRIASGPLRELVRRLLLTTAPPPPAAADDDASILALRARLLTLLGDPASAEALVSAAGRETPDAAFAWSVFEARLLAGDAAGACRLTREQRDGVSGLDWQMALIFCQLLAERTDQAQFSLSLLRERRAPVDPLFLAVADGLANRQLPRLGENVRDEAATPLNFALLQLAWTDFPAGFVDVAPAGVVAAVARTRDRSNREHLDVAIRAESLGAYSTEELRKLVAQLKVTRQEMAAALTIADAERPERAVALLYRAAEAQRVPAARAEVLERLWRISSKAGLSGPASRLAAPLLAEIPLLPEFAWFAGVGSRMALRAGDVARGLGWYDVVAAASFTDPEAQASATALWPLLRLALGDVRRLPAQPLQPNPADVARGVSVVAGAVKTTQEPETADRQAIPPGGEIAMPWDRRRLDLWIEAESGRDRAGAPARAAAMLALLDAVGDPVPEAAWRATLPPWNGSVDERATVVPHAAYRLGLVRAAADGRRGEAILFAALVLGSRDPVALDAASLYAIADGLARVGRPEFGRAFALDAALSAGL